MGPRGEGPMTGRGAGYCAGNDAPGYTSPNQTGRYGQGGGRGRQGGGGGGGRQFRGGQRGFGRAWANWPAEPAPLAVATDDQLSLLQRLVHMVDELKTRLERLEGAPPAPTPTRKDEP